MPLPVWGSLSRPVRIILASGFVAAIILIIFFLGKDGQLYDFLLELLSRSEKIK